MTQSPSIARVLLYSLLILLAVVSFFPMYVTLLNSVKTDSQLLTSVMNRPENLSFDNYREAFVRMRFIRSFLNTSIITAIGVVGIVCLSSMAAYKLSRTKGRLSTFLFFLFVSSMLIPFQSIMIPLVFVSKYLGLRNSVPGLGVMCVGLGINMGVFLVHGFVKGVPRELDESALIDGAGPMATYWRIIFPLLKPIIFTVAILDFLWLWNDFLLPLIMLSSNRKYTLVLATSAFFGKYNNEWGLILAGLTMVSIPVVVFYLSFQKHIVSGITAGSVKG